MKDCKSQWGWRIQRKQYLSDKNKINAHKLTETVTAQDLHRSKPDSVPVLRGRKGHELPTPNQEALSKRHHLANEKLVFPNGISMGILPIL